MAQPQNNVSLTAPGFAGLNTQDSPLDMNYQFASVANNCVIDNFGRIASRKGLQAYTTNPEAFNSNPVESVGELILADGTTYLFVCADSKIFLHDTETTFDATALTLPAPITGNNWQIVSFNDKAYFVQSGHPPLVFDPAVAEDSVQLMAYPSGAPQWPNAAHAAFGRLWLAAFDDNSTAVWWSGLLDGEQWDGGGSGAIQTSEYWPSGFDQVTTIAAHNDFLVIFGQRNILLYTTTADVASTLSLSDTIEGIGCLSRDSVVGTGIDFMFVDATGVRSLNRTIQEKSVPLGDISRNVRQEFQLAIRVEENPDDIKAVFHVEDSFYACFLPTNPKTYVLDTWNPLQGGAARVTVWTNLTIRCGIRLNNRTTFFGGTGGLYQYQQASDIRLDTDKANAPIETSIPMEYYTHPLDFGSPSNLIFPKQVDVTLFGGYAGDLTINWGYDYRTPDKSKTLPLKSTSLPAFWSQEMPPGSEWGDNGVISYWTQGGTINQLRYNIWGSGRNVKVGFYTEILGSTVSIQELNIQVLQGRIL